MIDRSHLDKLIATERERFTHTHAESAACFKRAQTSLLAGVPMPWMTEWASPYPLFVSSAQGARFVDVDGHEYVDFCLGDTGAMTGHAPPAVARAVAERFADGASFMLPTEDSIWVAEELTRRFGLDQWQFCLTATDANRFALRHARALTGRNKVLVFNWCYHGSVDEALITLDERGGPMVRDGSIGPPVDPSLTTRVIEWNSIEALEGALREEDIACVLAEPAMTNIGIIHPDPGYHDALRTLTRQTGTLLVIDETHTICAGPGGYTGRFTLEPDMLTIGKPLASGIPAAAYGLSAEVAAAILRDDGLLEKSDTGGVGGTLSGNALSLGAMRATLESVLTGEAFERMESVACAWADGVRMVLGEYGLDWHVGQLGCRVEYWFSPTAPRNGGQAAAAVDAKLSQFMHLHALNRGILLTPFHNMALMSPATTLDDVDVHTAAFAEAIDALVRNGSLDVTGRRHTTSVEAESQS
ncbi:MAG: transaminase [Gaiellaceae bacterium MAG52_C11]|nr:transaminase [Candidatus Gaiellasilicea maunaloa]